MTAMDWTYPANAGDAEIFEIGRRLAEALGRAPDATSFVYDPRAMLRTTREIEQAARGGNLLVGFQRSDKLLIEAGRYADLIASGTDVTVWAMGPRPDDLRLAELDYREASRDTRRLDAQWFLVSDSRSPWRSCRTSWVTRPVSASVAPPRQASASSASSRTTPTSCALLADTLRPLGAPKAARPPRAPSETARAIASASNSIGPSTAPSDAGDGSVIVPVGRGADRDAIVAALAIARREGRSLVVVDRSAEGFRSPYSDLRGDDAARPSPERLFDAATARIEGRNVVAEYLDAATSAGVEAGAWYPTKAGADGLADAARRFGGAIIVLPSDAGRPGLAERLRGMAIEGLRSTVAIPVLVADRA